MKANSNLKPFLKRILLMLAIVLTLAGVPSLENGNNFPFSTVTVEAATKLTAPTISSISNASTGVKLKWKKSSKATGYYVYRKTSSGSWKKIKTIKKNTTVSYTDTTAKNGTTYSYKVTAYSGKTTKSSATKKNYAGKCSYDIIPCKQIMRQSDGEGDIDKEDVWIPDPVFDFKELRQQCCHREAFQRDECQQDGERTDFGEKILCPGTRL